MDKLNLASGASHFRSPEAAVSTAIEALNAGKTVYGPTEGTPELRLAIAETYKAQGVNIMPEQVLVTPGTKNAIFNLLMALLRDGDEVVVPTPAWFGFNELVNYSRGKLVPFATTLEDNYNLDASALRQTLTEQSRVLLLTNPANPTGRMYTKTELQSIVDLLHDFPDLYLISDEIYDHFTYGEPFTSILACKGPKERIIVVNGFSKNFAMSGWRIGFMIGPEIIVKQCTDFQGGTFSGVSVFVQDAAQAVLEHRQEALQPMQQVLQEHRQLMQQALATIPDVKFYLPEGAYYFFPDLGHYLKRTTPNGETIKTTADLCRYLDEQVGLQVVPGDGFGAPPGFVRMSFAVEREVLLKAMEQLKTALLQLV